MMSFAHARRLAAALALALLAARGAAAATWQTYERLPGAEPVRVRVQGRERVYFRITPSSPLAMTVDGPARLRVVTRVELPDTGAVVRYRVRASEGPAVYEDLSTESSAASKVELVANRGRVVGKSRRMTFHVPPGRRRVELSLAGASAALVRVQHAAAARPETAMVGLTPVAAERSVSVVEGQRTLPYYSVLPGKPVRIRVVGPTTLELLARLDFDATMRGTQPYRLRLKDGDRTLREVELRTRKATTATYANLPNRVPGRLDRVRVPLGEGLHEISVELVRPARGAVEVHPQIPAPAVGNTP